MLQKNKKIKNAESIIYNGIKFRSKIEKEVYVKLIENGFTPEYEKDKFIIWNGFRPNHPINIDGVEQLTKNGKIPKILNWTYTPDFKIEYNGYIIYIEVKGFGNDTWPYKRKLFLKLINDKNNILFFEISKIKWLTKIINQIKSL